MKNFLIDLVLVGLLLFMINGIMGNYNIQKEMFNQNIEQFEVDIASQYPLNNNYGMIDDDSENIISIIILKISEVCIKIIETIVLIISNIISTLL